MPLAVAFTCSAERFVPHRSAAPPPASCRLPPVGGLRSAQANRGNGPTALPASPRSAAVNPLLSDFRESIKTTLTTTTPARRRAVALWAHPRVRKRPRVRIPERAPGACCARPRRRLPPRIFRHTQKQAPRKRIPTPAASRTFSPAGATHMTPHTHTHKRKHPFPDQRPGKPPPRPPPLKKKVLEPGENPRTPGGSTRNVDQALKKGPSCQTRKPRRVCHAPFQRLRAEVSVEEIVSGASPPAPPGGKEVSARGGGGFGFGKKGNEGTKGRNARTVLVAVLS